MDKIELKGLRWTVGYITRSNASTPLIILYFLICIFCLTTKDYGTFKIVTLLFAFSFIIVFIFRPNRFRSERYNLEEKKMNQLGEKGKNFELTSNTEVFQPINIPKERNIK